MTPDLISLLPDVAADRAPGAQVFVAGAEGLTNAALARGAGQMAQVLHEAGVRKGDRVGVYLRKSLRSALAVYGITRLGAAYVPLDPAAPPERLAAMIAHCGIRCLVTDAPMRPALAQLLPLVPQVDRIVGADAVPWTDVAIAPERPAVPCETDDMAYLMFTSGSTGVPKAMVHTHRSGLAYTRAITRLYDVRPGDRVTLHSALHFDMSIFALFGAPLAGATGVIVPDAIARLPAEAVKLMDEARITHWYSVPFALIEMLDRGALMTRTYDDLRWIIFAGEPFMPQPLRGLMRALPNVRFSNHYGPAEVNACTTYDVPTVADVPDAGLPIGTPWDVAEGVVLSEDDLPVGQGEVGELVIASDTRMQGYWADPDRTAQAWYHRPADGTVFYRTGDLVQEAPDGNLRYLGRKDRQIKLRGFRIELSEVELALCAHPAVVEAAAFADAETLVAAVTLDRGVEPAEVLAQAARVLPTYAVPATLHVLQSFPRTATGKVDHRAVAALFVGQTGPAPV